MFSNVSLAMPTETPLYMQFYCTGEVILVCKPVADLQSSTCNNANYMHRAYDILVSTYLQILFKLQNGKSVHGLALVTVLVRGRVSGSMIVK